MSAQIVAIANQKGGVGKTTAVYHLARSATKAGQRVLLVDADPQGNLTSLAADWPGEADVDDVDLTGVLGLADALTRSQREQVHLREVIVPTVFEGADLVPTVEALDVVRDELVVAGVGRERRLSEALAEVTDDYDLILIDTAPNLDVLLTNALVAAHGVAILTHTRKLSLDGLSKMLGTIDEVRAYYNPALEIRAVIPNQHALRTVAGREWITELTEAVTARGIVLSEAMPSRTMIADSSEAGVALDTWPDKDAPALAALFDTYLTTITRTTREDA